MLFNNCYQSEKFQSWLTTFLSEPITTSNLTWKGLGLITSQSLPDLNLTLKYYWGERDDISVSSPDLKPRDQPHFAKLTSHLALESSNLTDYQTERYTKVQRLWPRRVQSPIINFQTRVQVYMQRLHTCNYKVRLLALHAKTSMCKLRLHCNSTTVCLYL